MYVCTLNLSEMFLYIILYYIHTFITGTVTGLSVWYIYDIVNVVILVYDLCTYNLYTCDIMYYMISYVLIYSGNERRRWENETM